MKIGILGTGVMGQGLLNLFTLNDSVSDVFVITRKVEGNKESLQASLDKHMERLISKGKLSPDSVDIYSAKLSVTTDYKVLADCAVVIEAVVENTEVKKAVLTQAAPFICSNTLMASNTSSMSITDLASCFDCPEKLVGVHFFNPPTVMQLVEVVVGQKTSPETIVQAVEFAKKMGKDPVIVQEAPGFVVNRMLIPMINEAIGILAEGVASKEDIDKAMKLGAHHPMGPLSLTDLIGNDVTLSILETLYSETGDPKYRAHPLLRKMVRAGQLGRKTGGGFFEY